MCSIKYFRPTRMWRGRRINKTCVHDEVIGFINSPNPSSRTTALGSTQPPTEMSTKNLPGGKGRPARKADNLTAICKPIVKKMWEPRRLTAIWAFTTCYRDSFTFTQNRSTFFHSWLLTHTFKQMDHARFSAGKQKFRVPLCVIYVLTDLNGVLTAYAWDQIISWEDCHYCVFISTEAPAEDINLHEVIIIIEPYESSLGKHRV
jgi:hypothetical protein